MNFRSEKNTDEGHLKQIREGLRNIFFYLALHVWSYHFSPFSTTHDNIAICILICQPRHSCSTAMVMSRWSFNITTLFLGKLRLSGYLVCILLLVTDNSPLGISGRMRMTIENIS